MLNFISNFAPAGVAKILKPQLPLEISLGQNPLHFIQTASGFLTASQVGLAVNIEHEYYEEYNVLVWQTSLNNTGNTTITDITITPLYLSMDLNPRQVLARVRHMSGSWHYDACYPPRAFRLQEEAFMTHDHSKPVIISGANAGEHVPILQFASGNGTSLSGFFVGFEWSGGWELRAGWKDVSWSGESISPFIVQGTMELDQLLIEPGQTINLPKVHMGFFEGENWTVLDNIQRRYIREKLAARLAGKLVQSPVSYDHWFGIYKEFDLDDLKRQADRAAEIGCEYFCLDAAWYNSKQNFMDGVGNWDTPDPRKFPQGKESIKELSEYTRNLGMGFGIWHLIQIAALDTDAVNKHPELYRRRAIDIYDGYMLKLETPQAVAFALDTLREWIRDWGVTWMRFESVPENGLDYNQGYNQVIDTLRQEFPQLYLETCNGGGQRLDLNMVRRTHGNWLSDHTSNPEVTRFMQTGALRFWPAHFLNMAVTAFRGHGDEEATAHQVLSRMVGTLSFNGDIAQWTPEATAFIWQYVEVFKQIRHLQTQDILFPLTQPRSVEDWDAVVYGNNSTEQQLLFVFRTTGKSSISIDFQETNGEWKKLLGPKEASLTRCGGQITVELPEFNSALWIKSK